MDEVDGLVGAVDAAAVVVADVGSSFDPGCVELPETFVYLLLSSWWCCGGGDGVLSLGFLWRPGLVRGGLWSWFLFLFLDLSLDSRFLLFLVLPPVVAPCFLLYFFLVPLSLPSPRRLSAVLLFKCSGSPE